MDAGIISEFTMRNSNYQIRNKRFKIRNGEIPNQNLYLPKFQIHVFVAESRHRIRGYSTIIQCFVRWQIIILLRLRHSPDIENTHDPIQIL